MLENNNSRIISRMAKRSVKSNKRRSLIMIFAIMLSSFMLFCIMTVGETYFKMHELQDIRMYGADFDALLIGGFTEEQLETCENSKGVTTIGMEARAGFAEKTDADDTLHSVLVWADKTYWNKQKNPAVKWIKGRYPEKVNEVMVTREVLKDCGKENLGIGDSFTLTYGMKTGSHTEEFVISGMWEGYGDQKVFYVSEDFYKQSGYQFSDTGSGILYMNFKSDIITEKKQNAFRDSLNLGKQQYFSYMAGKEQSVQILVGMAGLVLITCLSAYLLIYNILYLSVSGNIRYYGLLQTVGMTGSQVYRLIQKQMLFIGAAGTTGGILLGMLTSFGILPGIVKMLGIRQKDISVTFHPAVFCLCIAVVGITVYLGSRKPARIATEISPMEALSYRSLSGRKESHKSGKGNLLWRMAKEQFLKDKKKTGIVVLSLAASLSVFLCLVTLIESHGARTVMSAYMNADLVITNDTLKKETREEWTQIMDQGFLKQLKENKAVKEVHPMSSAQIIVPWEPKFSDVWMREFYETWMDHPYEEDIEEYKQHPEKFYSFMTGIDEKQFDYLNSTLDKKVDKKAFMQGKTCIIYKDRLSFDMKKLKNKKVTYSLYDDKNKGGTLKIAGLADDGQYAGVGVGMAPVIIVSDAYMKQMKENPYISRVNIMYREEYDVDVEQQIKGYLNQTPYASDVSYDSKIESMEKMKKAQGNMMGVGAGIAVILALIGIMNYINTVSGNIQNRQVELSVMESVGMTESQLKKLLIREGMLYAGSSLLITATVGLAVTYISYQYLNYMGIDFRIPVLPALGMAVSAVVLCVMIPLIAYKILTGKKSIVERIREFE